MRTKKIAVTINKGGMGKTMVTRSMATAAALAGLNVLALDLDTQQNTTGWGTRRQKLGDKPLPLTKFTTENDLHVELLRAESDGCDLVFIDTPPGRSSEAMAAVEFADLVLIPFWNDQDAYEGVLKTASLARRIGRPAYGVLNFATPNSRTHEDTAREVLSVIPLPFVPVVLHRYEAHRLASIKGLTAQESEPDSIPSAEIAALWNWLSATLQKEINAIEQLYDDAIVHKGAA